MNEGVSLNLYNISGTVTFYPGASSDFFLKAGAGLALVDDLGTGFGVLGGIGSGPLRMSRTGRATPKATSPLPRSWARRRRPGLSG